MSVGLLMFQTHDYNKTKMTLYDRRSSNGAKNIEEIKEGRIYVDTIEDILNNLYNKHDFNNDFQFYAYWTHPEIIIRSIIFFQNKGYNKLEKVDEYGFYRFQKT
jgi:hypothetical protein